MSEVVLSCLQVAICRPGSFRGLLLLPWGGKKVPSPHGQPQTGTLPGGPIAAANKSLRSPAEGEGNEGFPPPPDIVKAMVFPVVIYGCESWTVKKAEY